MLTESHITEFREKGYTILVNALTEEEFSLLHEEADILSNYLMSEGYDLVTDLGCIVEPFSCGFLDDVETNEYKIDYNQYSKIRNSIYWNNNNINASDIILHKYGRTWASQLLLRDHQKKDVYLLNEQFIIKPPFTSKLSQFAWHKDSDYYQDVKHRQEPTIACWTALDDVNETNGTVQLLDFTGTGKTLIAPAGSILFMSNQLLHQSTGNASRKFRRAFMPQFSTIPFIDSHNECISLAVKCTPDDKLPAAVP